MGSISSVRKPPHSKTFGMELECIPNRQIERNSAHIGFWEETYDASLSYGGVEFVSQPMPYNMLINQVNRLHKRINGWKVDHQCGLHIHVSRQYWSAKREEAFSKFLYMTTARERELFFGRDSRYAHPRRDPDEKYRAINLLHDHTYEFRVWKAGDLAWTLEALRRTKLIVEYRGEWSMDAMLNLLTLPEQPPLIKAFNQAANINPCVEIPAVRRIRRAPAVPVF